MTHGTRTLSWILFAALSLSSLLSAQQTDATLALPPAGVPRVIQFSGIWHGAKAGVVGFTFAIYKDQEGGAALWMETQNLQVDSKGHYTALLGSTKTEGLPGDLFTSGEARWVGITANGEKEEPRVLLVAVPYALHAADAETVGGLPPSAFVLTPQFAVPASPGPSGNAARPLLPGKRGKAAFSTALTGTGTADFLPLWTPDGSTLGNSTLFQTTGAKVGIGTQTPATKLDVNGSTTVRGTLKLPAKATATASAGSISQPITLAASAFNNLTNAAENDTFQWQAEPSLNNTKNASATLNLLFGRAGAAPAETGTFFDAFGGLLINSSAGAIIANSSAAATINPAPAIVGASTATTNGGVGVQGSSVTNIGVQGFGITGVAGTSNVGTGVRGFLTGNSGEAISGVLQGTGGIAVEGDAASGGTAGRFLSSDATNPTLFASNTSTGPIFQAFNGGTKVAEVTPGRLTVVANGSSTILGDLGCSAGFVGLQFGGPVTCVRASVIGDGTNTILNRVSGGRLDFREDNVTQMSLASGGKLGLGTVTPAKQLDVVGVSGGSHVAMAQFGSAGAHDSNSLLVYNSSGFAEVFAVGGTNNFVPGSAVGDGGLRVNAGHKILFGDAGAARVTIDSSGNVGIKGNLSKGGGSFKIDHPLDPANKYLYHSFVESPDMMNVYNGNITTDRRGLAKVTLPGYFEALNRDFRYQLTVIGQFAQAIVAKEIQDNAFVIKTNRPGVKVSWQVTGIRHDAYAEAHRIQVEVEKSPDERGHYIHPELFGARVGESVEASANPDTAQVPR